MVRGVEERERERERDGRRRGFCVFPNKKSHYAHGARAIKHMLQRDFSLGRGWAGETKWGNNVFF